MSERMSVHAMVQKVLADSKAKLAADLSTTKVASAEPTQTQPAGSRSGQGVNDFLKIADACDHLSKNIHLVNDKRTPQEKLAEYAAIHEAIQKNAFALGNGAPADPSQPSDAGDNSTGSHQTQTANEDSQSPKTVGLDGSGPGIGDGNSIPCEETNTPGTSLEAGKSGDATPGHQSPKSVAPSEKANPMDAANALETNSGMMMADQPEALLKQNAAAPVSADMKKKAMVLLARAQNEGVPVQVAKAMLKMAGLEKAAEDALNPAQISAGTAPLLQSAADASSAQMQGTEPGEGTPRETAPTSGEGGGRELLNSVESVINSTKGQAKSQNKGALAELLTEPAMSSAHDNVLQQSLDNTSGAGVKISAAQVNAARELLRKFQDGSPENAQKLAALAKLAQDPDMAAGGGAPPAPGEMAAVPEEAAGPEAEMLGGAEGMEGMPMEPEVPSEEALEAAKSGVTPEELAQAEELLAAQGAIAEQAASEEAEAGMEAPVAGEEGKESQLGAPPMGGGAGAMPPPSAPTM